MIQALSRRPRRHHCLGWWADNCYNNHNMATTTTTIMTIFLMLLSTIPGYMAIPQSPNIRNHQSTGLVLPDSLDQPTELELAKASPLAIPRPHYQAGSKASIRKMLNRHLLRGLKGGEGIRMKRCEEFTLLELHNVQKILFASQSNTLVRLQADSPKSSRHGTYEDLLRNQKDNIKVETNVNGFLIDDHPQRNIILSSIARNGVCYEIAMAWAHHFHERARRRLLSIVSTDFFLPLLPEIGFEELGRALKNGTHPATHTLIRRYILGRPDTCSGGHWDGGGCADNGCGCDKPGPSGCDNKCGSTKEDLGCGCGKPGPSGCDNKCGSTKQDFGCGCGRPGPSGCDNKCGSTKQDFGCGCGRPGPSGCDNKCGSTKQDHGCGCGKPGPSGCDNECGSTKQDFGCGCGKPGPSGCDNKCGSTKQDHGCGCGKPGPSGCDNKCGSTKQDFGCGCGKPGPSGCDNKCGSTKQDFGCGCGKPGPSGCDNKCGSTEQDFGCGCGNPGPLGCDNKCGSTKEDLGCGCGIDCATVDLGCGAGLPGPSGCDNKCGSTKRDHGCGCGKPGPSGCDNKCGSTKQDHGCGCGKPGPSGCDNKCGSTNQDHGCGCGKPGPSGCDNKCGSTKQDFGCGCGKPGPSGCDNKCGSTKQDHGCGCGKPGPSGCDNKCGSTKQDFGCGCGKPGPSGCDNKCGSTKQDHGCGCGNPGPSGCDMQCSSNYSLSCGKGFYQNGTCFPGLAQLSCVPCKRGTYKSTADDGPCKACVATCGLGKEAHCTIFGKPKCLECPQGKFKNSTDSSNCQLCTGNRFQNLFGATSCKICPPKNYTVASNYHGNDNCYSCADGFSCPGDGNAYLFDSPEASGGRSSQNNDSNSTLFIIIGLIVFVLFTLIVTKLWSPKKPKEKENNNFLALHNPLYCDIAEEHKQSEYQRIFSNSLYENKINREKMAYLPSDDSFYAVPFCNEEDSVQDKMYAVPFCNEEDSVEDKMYAIIAPDNMYTIIAPNITDHKSGKGEDSSGYQMYNVYNHLDQRKYPTIEKHTGYNSLYRDDNKHMDFSSVHCEEDQYEVITSEPWH